MLVAAMPNDRVDTSSGLELKSLSHPLACGLSSWWGPTWTESLAHALLAAIPPLRYREPDASVTCSH
jgi:hypothetical protein